MDTKEAVAIIKEILTNAGLESTIYHGEEICVPVLSRQAEEQLYDLITAAHFEIKKTQIEQYKSWDISYQNEYLCLIFFENHAICPSRN